MRLTRTGINSLEARAAEYHVWDETMPGFGVRVPRSGRKVYILRYRNQQRQNRKAIIGRCDVLMPDRARELARAMLVAVAEGKDPVADRRATVSGDTMADLAEKHQADRQGHVKRGSLVNYEVNWRIHIVPRLGKRRVAEITEGDMIGLQAELGAISTQLANRCMIMLHFAFGLAERLGMRPKNSNPTTGLQHYKAVKRKRVLKPDELRALIASLEADDSPTWAVAWLARLLMLTGQRRSEWAMARWEWVDLHARTLTLPDSKTGPKVVPLSLPVVAVLREMRKRHNGPWVCPNLYGTNGLVSVNKQWQAILKRAGLSGLRMHDLRHTFGSVGHASGISLRDVSDLLGHGSLATTEWYVHGASPEGHAMAERATQAIIDRAAIH